MRIAHVVAFALEIGLGFSLGTKTSRKTRALAPGVCTLIPSTSFLRRFQKHQHSTFRVSRRAKNLVCSVDAYGKMQLDGRVTTLGSASLPEIPPPMLKLDPTLIAARWVCGDLLPENVPETAIGLIEAGYEEPSVYRVAAEDNVSARADVESLLQRMFNALGVTYPISLEDARVILSRQIAREVVAGLKNPWSAAKQLESAVPPWETRNENIQNVFWIADESEWDPAEGRNQSTLDMELVKAFERLACS
jgi:hypothetical protein